MLPIGGYDIFNGDENEEAWTLDVSAKPVTLSPTSSHPPGHSAGALALSPASGGVSLSSDGAVPIGSHVGSSQTQEPAKSRSISLWAAVFSPTSLILSVLCFSTIFVGGAILFSSHKLSKIPQLIYPQADSLDSDSKAEETSQDSSGEEATSGGEGATEE
jgi:hypothetical protein